MSIAAWVTNVVFTLIGPLIIYAVYHSRSKFVAFHAMQALLLGVAVTVVGAVGAVLTAITFGLAGFVVFPAMAIIGLLNVIVSILIGVKAGTGEWAEVPVIGCYARRISGASNSI